MRSGNDGGWIARRAGRTGPRQPGIFAFLGSKRSCFRRMPCPRRSTILAFDGGKKPGRAPPTRPRQPDISALVGSKRSCSKRLPRPRQSGLSPFVGGLSSRSAPTQRYAHKPRPRQLALPRAALRSNFNCLISLGSLRALRHWRNPDRHSRSGLSAYSLTSVVLPNV